MSRFNPNLFRSLSIALLACIAVPSPAAAEDAVIRRQADASFADVREALVTAIENRGLVISYTAHIGDMLARTANDLGTREQIYQQAEVVEFCSASLSRKMMAADPHDIVFCPFSLAVYTLPGDEKHTWIAYRKASGKAGALVTPLLEAIAGEAAQP